jgi:hypothetical protein
VKPRRTPVTAEDAAVNEARRAEHQARLADPEERTRLHLRGALRWQQTLADPEKHGRKKADRARHHGTPSRQRSDARQRAAVVADPVRLATSNEAARLRMARRAEAVPADPQLSAAAKAKRQAKWLALVASPERHVRAKEIARANAARRGSAKPPGAV